MLTLLVIGLAAAVPAGLAARCAPTNLTPCSADQLLWLLSTEGINRFFPEVDPPAVRKAVAERVALPKLLAVLKSSRDLTEKEAIVFVLSERKDPEIASAFASILGTRPDSSSCWMAVYLARSGDVRALDFLDKNYWKCPVSSWQWSYVVPVFGEQKFFPATAHLLESLNAASLNLAEAALHTLGLLYPGASPSDVETPAVARRYYEARARARR
jgi:hypothetical protein